MLEKIEDLLLLILIKIIRGISSFLTKIVVFIIIGFYSIITFLIKKYCERRKRKKEEKEKNNQKIQHFYNKNLQKSSPERSTKSEQFIFLSSNENSNNPCKLKYVIKSDPILKKKGNLSVQSNKKDSQTKYSNSPSLKLTNKEIQLELKSDQEEIESIKLEKISQNAEKGSYCKIKSKIKEEGRKYSNELGNNSPEMILSQKSKSSTVNTSSSNYDTILMNLRKLNQNVLDSKYSQEKNERKNVNFLEIMLSYKSLFNYDYSYCINDEPVFIFDLFNSIYPVFDYFGKEYKKNIAKYLIKRGVSVNQAKIFINNIREYGEISEIKNILDVENNYDPVSFFTEVEIKTFHKFSPKIDSEVIKVFKGIKHKKFIFTIGDLKIIKSVLFSLGLDNFIDGIFYLDYNDKSIPTKKSIYPYEIIDMVIQTNKVYYFDNCEDNLHFARKRGWNVFQVDEITFRKKMKSILKFLGFEIVSCE